ITVGEMSSTTIGDGVQYSNPEDNELSMIFSFHHLKVDYENGNKWTRYPFDFMKLKQLLDEWQKGMEEGNGWNALFWNNHDQPRASNRFGNIDRYPFETATMLAQTIHLMRGTPFIYQGEEIGMVNPSFDSIDDYKDIETINAYKTLMAKGSSSEEALKIIQEKSRDNSRIPMQWTAGEQAGFTSGNPWLKVDASHKKINAQRSELSKEIREYYKRLIHLRKELPVISEGTYEGIEMEHPSIYD